MNARDFHAEISRGLSSGERFEDAAVLVDLVAKARAKGREGDETDYRFALTILCFLWDVGKNEAYQLAVRQMRQTYRGIADSDELRTACAKSIAPELIDSRSIDEALRKPVERLFVPETSGGVEFAGAGSPSKGGSRGKGY
jgi:hypothetical protein